MCNSHSVGHRTTCDELPDLSEICVECNSLAVVHSTRLYMRRLPFSKMSNVTHFLLVIGQDVMRLLFRNMCNVTHKLLVIGQGVMGLPCTKCAMSLTFCWP